MELLIESLDGIDSAAREFVSLIGSSTVFALYGGMGVGKTTFVKAVCHALGVEDEVNSPTFAIINEYETADGSPVYHFDFYRVKSLREAMDIGCQDYFYSGHLCFIEWPELVEPLLPADAVRVVCEELPKNPGHTLKIHWDAPNVSAVRN